MKILHVIDYFQPQMGYQETYLAREQIKAGHDVVVLTSNRYRQIFFQGQRQHDTLGQRTTPVGFAIENGIPVQRLPVRMEAVSRPWLKGLEAKIIELAPDAIHVHGLVSLTAWRVARLKRRQPGLAQTTLLVDDHMYPEVSNTPLRKIYPVLRPTLIASIRTAADWLVGVSSATRDFMAANYGLPPDEIRVIPLGVDADLFRPDLAARTRVRQQFGFADSDFVCISTGKIAPRKQIEVLVAAVGQLAADFPQIRLLLVGYADPAYRAQLENQITSLGLQNRVNWQPALSQDQLPAYFNAADAAIWPAEHSISFLEAMACGLPILVSQAPKPAEDVRYQNGLTYATGNPAALAAQLQKWLQNPALARQMGLAGRAAVARQLAWAAINAQFMDCYTHPNR